MKYEIVSERRVRYQVKIGCARDAYNVLKRYAKCRQEQFIVMTLNCAHEVISINIVSIGLVNRTIVHPREVFYCAIKDSASAIVISHNHPSGQTEASEEDRAITMRLQDASDIIGIPILDHVIITKDTYASLLEKNMMRSA